MLLLTPSYGFNRIYVAALKGLNPQILDTEVDVKLDNEFREWFSKLCNLTDSLYPYVSKCTLHICLNYKHVFLFLGSRPSK